MIKDPSIEELLSRIKELETENARLLRKDNEITSLNHQLGIKQQELFHSKQMLQLILDHIPQRVFWKDKNFRYLGCNKGFAKDAGIGVPSNLVGKDDFDLTWKETALRYRADDKKVVDEETSKTNYLEPQDAPDGTRKWLKTSKLPIYDKDQKVIGLLGTYEDITQQLEAEERLKNELIFSHTLMDNSPVAIIYINHNGEIRFANQKAQRLFGYDEKNLRGFRYNSAEFGSRYQNGEPVRDEDMPFEMVKKTLKPVKNIEHSLILKGERRYISINSSPVLNSNGELDGVVTALIDITEQKNQKIEIQKQNEEIQAQNEEIQAQNEEFATINEELRQSLEELEVLHDRLTASENNLREANENLNVTLRSIGDGVMVTDLNGNVTKMNLVAEELTGWSEEDAIGKPVTAIFNIVNAVTGKPAENPIYRVLENGRIMGLANHTLLLSKDGSRYHIADSAAPIHKNDGSMIGVIMVFRDVTEKYEMEKALQESETQLRNKLDTIMSPDLETADLQLTDIIDSKDLQHIQDAFSNANNVASVILDTRGNPLTQESHSQELCKLIRKTTIGARNCFEADKWLRQEAFDRKKPVQEKCSTCGLLEAGAPIIIGGKHLGTWMIGQSKTADTDEEQVIQYAGSVGANKGKVKEAFRKMPVISEEQFNKTFDLLWVLAGEISSLGYNNLKLSRDIQEKLRAKKQLKLSEERFKTLLQATPDLIFLIKTDGTFQDIFTSDLSRLFMPKNQIIGRKYQDILPPNVSKSLSIAAMRANENGSFQNFEYHWLYNGNDYWFSGRVSRFEVDGSPGLICFVRDITEQRNAETSLRESEEKFRQISEQSLMSIGIIQDGRVVYSNHAYSRLSGYSRDELRNLPEENVSGLIHHEDREFVLNQAQKVLEGKHDAISRFAYRLVSVEGKLIWVDNFFSRIKFNKQPALLVTLVDITEQKKAREQLTRHEAQLNAILNNLPHLAWLKNSEGRFLAVNETLAEAAGTTVAEMLNRTDFDFWPQELAKKYVEDDQKVITEKKRIYTEEKVAVVSGTRWFETFKTPVYDQDGEVIGTTGISLDITDRKAAGEELHQTKERLENIINTSNAIIYTMSPDGQLTWVSNSWKELLGNRPETVTGKSYKGFIHDEDIPTCVEFFKRVLSQGKRLKGLEFRIKNAQGEWVWFTTTGSRFFESAGDYCQVFLGVATEITTRKHAEEALRESEALYRQIINTSPDAITVTDTEGRIMLISPNVLEMYDHQETEASVIGRSILNWVAPEEQQRVMDDIRELINTDRSETKQYKLVKSNGESFFGEINSAIVRDIKGDPRSMVSITRNITERKKAEEDLIRAKEKAEEADRLKSAFLSNMSHEIRTPMNGIIGFSNLLADEDLSVEQRKEYIRIIRNNGKSLVNLIDDIIDFARIEAGQVTIKKEKCDLNILLHEVYHMFNQVLQDSKKVEVKLRLSVPDHHPLILQTDPVRLRQILNNLTGNAIKFTDAGSVEIGYKLNDHNHIHIFVKDTGIGLPPDKAEMIFERFRQIDESHTRRHRGTGLGLAISRHLVNLLGGEIRVDSEVGKGSVFHFTLPYDPKETELIIHKETIKVQTKPEIPDWTDHFVLVAEDEEINFFYLSQLLKKTNITVIRAKNGSEAVDLARKNPQVKLILMDIKMPVMNGYEATKIIKEANPGIVIIAQTAYAMEEEKKKCIEAGCDDYLSKPIEKQTLFEKMNKYLTRT